MLKRWKVNSGFLLLSVFVLLLVLPVISGSMQPLSQEHQETSANLQTSGLKCPSYNHVVKSLQVDDNYEPNDVRTSAYDLTNYEGTWLSTIDGLGIQWDDDWYEIYISSGNSHLNVELTFTHALGDIDIRVTNAMGASIDSSAGVSDGESIDVDVSVGTYYLEIYYDDEGNSYDLWWDDSVSGTTTPPPTFPFFPPLLMFIVIGVAITIVIIIVVIVCVVVLVRRSTPRRPPIRRPIPTRPAKTTTKPSPTTQPGPTKRCPNCGSAIEPADKFCVGCGKTVN